MATRLNANGIIYAPFLHRTTFSQMMYDIVTRAALLQDHYREKREKQHEWKTTDGLNWESSVDSHVEAIANVDYESGLLASSLVLFNVCLESVKVRSNIETHEREVHRGEFRDFSLYRSVPLQCCTTRCPTLARLKQIGELPI